MLIDSKCWNCSFSYKGFKFFCKNCNKIQKPKELDAFQIFGLEHKFIIDEERLEVLYHNLQSMLHPDKFINNTEQEKLFSQVHSSNLNGAYQTLMDVISRANELLRYFGMDFNSNESFTDPNVLNEVMDLQDERENLKTKLEKDNFKKKINKTISILISNLDQLFCSKKIIEANKTKIKISYLNKIIKEI